MYKPVDFFSRDYRLVTNRVAHPFGHLLDQKDARRCCKNLRAMKVSKETPGLWVGTCLECGNVHYRMRAESGLIFGAPQPLGK